MLFSAQALKPTCRASASAPGSTYAGGLGCGYGAKKGGGISTHSPTTLLSISLGPQVSLHPAPSPSPMGHGWCRSRDGSTGGLCPYPCWCWGRCMGTVDRLCQHQVPSVLRVWNRHIDFKHNLLHPMRSPCWAGAVCVLWWPSGCEKLSELRETRSDLLEARSTHLLQAIS